MTDTIYNQVIVNDTIIRKIDMVKFDNFYETILTVQDKNFDHLLVYIGIIVTILIVLVTVFNFVVAKKLFEINAKKIFSEEKDKLIKQFDERFDRLNKISNYRLWFSDAESLRSAVINEHRTSQALSNLFSGLEIVIDLDERLEIIKTVGFIDSILQTVTSSTDIRAKKHFDYEKALALLDKIPQEINLQDKINTIKQKMNEIVNE